MSQIVTDFYKGRTVEIPMTYKVDGVAFDITGYTFTFMMKVSLSDSDVDAVITKDAVITDAVNGELILTLSNSDTDVDTRKYYYDFIVVDDGGAIQTLDQNTLKVLKPVNKP